MKRLQVAGLIGKVCLPFLLISILGIAIRPHTISVDLHRAQHLMEIGSFRGGYAALTRAAEFISEPTDSWESAGHAALAANDAEIAISFWLHAIETGNISSSGYIALGDAYQHMGQSIAAIQTWESVIMTEGPLVAVYERLANVHKHSGDYLGLVSDLRALAKMQPDKAQTLYQLGVTLAAVQPESALAYLVQAAEIDPELVPQVETIQRTLATARLADEPAYTFLSSGRVLGVLNDWDLAAEAFRRATVLRPDYAEAWAFLGEALQHSGSVATLEVENGYETSVKSPGQDGRTAAYALGITEIEKALSLDPNSVVANTFMAYYWQRQHDYGKALTYLSVAASLEPDNPMLLVEFGNTLALKGDLPTAQIYYRRAVNLAPRDPFYWRMLANFCIHHEIYIRTIALPAARQVVLLNTIDPVGLDVLAQVYILLNDLVSAQRLLQRVFDINPFYPAAHLHLGQVYLLMGDSIQAYKQLSMARTQARQDQASADQAERLLKHYFP